MTDNPKAMTYSSFLSRDTIRIILTIAALNDLDVHFFYTGNAYLNAYVYDKVWSYASSEFGPDCAGCVTVPVKALYGLNFSGASFHNNLARQGFNENFGSCLVDTDTWMRPTVNPNRAK